MAKKEAQPKNDYIDFAALHDKPDDDEVLAFIQKHGPLGLDPYAAPGGASWEYKGMFLMPEPKGLWFNRWNNVNPVPEGEVKPIKETPDLIRQEARKMDTLIRLWQIIEECTDGAGYFQKKKFFAHEEEVKRLTEEIRVAWPGISTFGVVFDEEEKSIMIPDLAFVFDSVLARIQLKVSRNTAARSIGIDKSPIPYKTNGRKLEIKESCLLARLWFEMISDMIEGTAPPRFCPYCNKLFNPTRPDQKYPPDSGEHLGCRAAAKQRDYRIRVKENEGQELRSSPGRPPKSKNNKGAQS